MILYYGKKEVGMNCLITGASLGIGHDLALKMASLNYDLLLTYNKNEEGCRKLQQEIISKYKVNCFIEKCNLISEQDIKKVIDRFQKKFGNIDVLVNNASVSKDNLIEDKTKKEFMEVLEVNLVGTFLMSKYVSSFIKKGGVIINMSSTDGIDTYSIYNIDYAVSKAGIIQLTKSFALSFPEFRTIAVAPNWVDTESTREMSQEYLQEELKRIGQSQLISKEKVIDEIIHIIVDKSIKSGSLIRIEEEEK